MKAREVIKAIQEFDRDEADTLEDERDLIAMEVLQEALEDHQHRVEILTITDFDPKKNQTENRFY